MKKSKIFAPLILAFVLLGCMGTDNEDEGSVSDLSSGTYEHEEQKVFTTAEYGFDGTGSIKGQLTLNSDKTFLLQGYLTVDGSITNLLTFEGKGKYSQSGSKLTLSERLERNYQTSTQTFTPWETPEDGSNDTSQLRNVTADTFQEYSEDEEKWITWSKI